MNKRFTFGSLRRTLKSFAHNNRGVSAVIVAFLAIPIFGAIGLSIDLGRAYVLKSKLSTALDAAGLAVGRNIFSTDAEIYADAQKYFDANFPSGYMGTAPITMNATTVTWDSTKENITLSVNANMNTTFMNVLGQPELTLGANTEIKRDNRGMELVLVLDNTGSMTTSLGTSSRIAVLKTAAKNLIDILYNEDEIRDKLWVGIVPYTTQVNVGPQNIDFLKAAYKTNILNNSTSIFTADNYNNTALLRDVTGDSVNDTVYGWKGCVEMRGDLNGGTVDMTDDPPANDFVPFFYGSSEGYNNNNKWKTYGVTSSGSRSPNRQCLPPILPLTAEKTTIKASIEDMIASSSGTSVNIGLVWGWRAISHRWNGRWYGSSTINLPTDTITDPENPAPYSALPLNDGELYMDKVVILMTDGQNVMSSSFYNGFSRMEEEGIEEGDAGYNSLYHTNGSGYLSEKTWGYAGMENTKTSQVCTSMKAAGIIIYTVLLVDGDSTMMKNCATSAKHAFVATTADELLDHFNTIGEELSNLRISK
ncbi:MAG: pilus assembly protein [Sneathiella sp.]|nr:pilus assembly protein [Sneathiella sp.]